MLTGQGSYAGHHLGAGVAKPARPHGADFQGPLRLEHFIEGGSSMFLCRINGTEVLTMGSMNFIENELRGIRAIVPVHLKTITVSKGSITQE